MSLGVSAPTDTLVYMAIPANMRVERIESKLAARLVVDHHYLHRKPPISHAYGLYWLGKIVGVVTYGTPASRHLQISACPSEPSNVIELNRLWVHDKMPKNTESWFVSRTLSDLPAKIVVSYADTREQHYGYIYRALNFNYAGWTDMERKTPRYDYIPHDPTQHTREAFLDHHRQQVRTPQAGKGEWLADPRLAHPAAARIPRRHRADRMSTRSTPGAQSFKEVT